MPFYSRFLTFDLKPRENIVSPWLPTQGLVMVYAPRGVGKNSQSSALPRIIHSIRHFISQMGCTQTSLRTLLGWEMPSASLQERLAKLIRGYNLELSASFNLITKDSNPNEHFSLATLEGQQQIEKHLGDVEVIIVDNISTLCPGKENDSESWAPIQAWALKMRASGRARWRSSITQEKVARKEELQNARIY